MPRARSILLAVSLGAAFVPLTPSIAAPAQNGSLASATYDEAVHCAAIDSIVLGAMRPGDEATLSPADRATAKAVEDHAVGWLVMAITLNAKGEAATKADFGVAINALYEAIAQAKDSAALEQVISPGLRRCVERESELFG